MEDGKLNVKSFRGFFSTNKESLLRIIGNLHNTLWLGLLFGLIGITGYAFNLTIGPGKILFLLIIIALASFISGFFLGFLFGIPKRDSNNESLYHVSSNLVDISDWLTKIIIGLGLVEIKSIPGGLESIGSYIQTATGAEASIKIFSVCCIIYFSVFGLYFGYNYIRLFLSPLYKGADDALETKKKELIKTTEILNKTNIIDDEGTLNSAKEMIEKYTQLTKSIKAEDEYTSDDWYYKGLNAYNDKEYKNAISFLENALEKDCSSKNAPLAYFHIGNAFAKTGNLPGSVEMYEKIIKDFPSFDHLAIVYSNIGDSLNKLQKTDDAIKYIEKSISLRPDYAYAWYNKACSYAISKDKKRMIESLKRAFDLDPKLISSAILDNDLKAYLNDIKDLIV